MKCNVRDWWYLFSAQFQQLLYHPDDSPADVGIKRLLVGPMMSLVPLEALSLAYFIARDREFNAWVTGLTVFVAAHSWFSAKALLTKRVGPGDVNVLMCSTVCGVLLLDWGILGHVGSPRQWVWIIPCVDILLCVQSDRVVIQGIISITLLWLFVTSSDSALSWGLAKIDSWSKPSAQRIEDRCDCSDPPCAIGAVSGVFTFLLYSLVTCLDFYFTRKFSDGMRGEQHRTLQVVHTAEDVAKALLSFDLVGAQVQLDALEEGTPMRMIFTELIDILGLYRPYLPDSLFVSCETQLPGLVDLIDPSPIPPDPTEDLALPGIQTSSCQVEVFTTLPGGSPQHLPRLGLGESGSPLHTASGVENPLKLGGSAAHSSPRKVAIAGPDLDTRLEKNASTRSLRIGSIFNSPRMLRKHSSLELWGRGSPKGSEFSADRANTNKEIRAAQLDTGIRRVRATVLFIEYSGTLPCHDQPNVETFDEAESFVRSVIPIIASEQGGVLSFNADTVAATWNAHKPCGQHARQGVGAALSLIGQTKCGDVCNVAVATGILGVGLIGTDTTRSAYVTGRPKDMCVALLHLCRQLRSPLLLTEHVREMMPDHVASVPVDIVPANLRDPCSGVVVVYEASNGTPSEAGRIIGDVVRSLRVGDVDAASRGCDSVLNLSDASARLRFHARRLRALSMSLASEEDQTFCRRWIGWDSDVQEAWWAQESPRTPRRARSRTPTDARAADSSQRAQTGDADTNHLEARLREDIRNQSPCGDTAVLPKEWVCSRGDKWRRADKRLGKGAFGEVWLGMSEDGAFCAVKAVRLAQSQPAAAAAPGRRRRAKDNQAERELNDILKEIGIMQRLRHENIVCYISSAVLEGFVVLCMEYVAGGSLDAVLKQFGALTDVSARRYTKAILKGLTFLHEHNIVHRDFKPGNVLLEIDGHCKIADFGASADLKKMAGGSDVVGTPLYMAPEACRGVATYASDIWGVGITVVEMLTGKVPYTFTEDDPFVPQTFLFRLGRDESCAPDIPDAHVVGKPAHRFVVQCLARPQEQRPTAQKLQAFDFVML